MGTAHQQPPGIRGQEGARTAFRVIGTVILVAELGFWADAGLCDSCGAALAR